MPLEKRYVWRIASALKWGLADCDDHHEIHIWPFAYQLYGWDMMTSVLIHEFGHVELLKAEGLSEGIEAERKANEYGQNLVHPELVPPHYHEHRKFFLRSYEVPGNWTQEQCLNELKSWRTQHTENAAARS